MERERIKKELKNAFVKSKYNLAGSKQVNWKVGQRALCASNTEVWGQIFQE